jgi:hypothetical protein
VSQSAFANSGNCVPAVSRRSTRIEKSVPLIILGKNRMGEPFMERTVAVSLNKHGCRYASRHDYGVGTWITLQVVGLISEEEKPANVRAVVRTLYPPASSRELQQVGVELETPSNVWGIVQPPSDWLAPAEPNGATAKGEAALAPADELVIEKESTAATESKPAPKLAEVAAFPSPAATETTKSHEAHRVVVTSEGLISALQGKLQHEAEKAVQTAIARQIEGAVREALGSIENARKSSIQELQELVPKQIEAAERPSKDGCSTESPQPWKTEMEWQRTHTERLAERLEEQAAELKLQLASTQEYVERIVRERPQQAMQWNEALAQVTSDFERTAALVMERRYERLRGDVQVVTQEALLKLNARLAETQALVQSAVNSGLEELRRETEAHLNMMLSETKERAGSALTSLNAESRANCDARLQAVQAEMARFADCATEQFQTRMKAFLYSCLVAAVGAVDEHAQATLSGLSNGEMLGDNGFGPAKTETSQDTGSGQNQPSK